MATAAAAVLYVTDRAGVWSIGRRLSPQPRDFYLHRTAIRSIGLPFLMVSIPVIDVITWITTHLATPKEWKAELA